MLFPLFDRNPHKRFPWLVLILIGLNLYFFAQSIQQGPVGFADTIYERGFVPQRLSQINDDIPIRIERVIEDSENNREVLLRKDLSTKPQEVYATMFTMMFLHGGLFHIISNMWMLWVFGDNIEDRIGRFVFVFFYLAGGVVAVLTQWAIDPTSTQPVIGASGAVSAVLGAYMVTYPMAKVKTLIFIGFPLLLDLPAFLVLGAWFVLQMIAGLAQFDMPKGADVSVAFWAHIGGFVTGALLMPMLTIGASPPDEDWRNESKEMFEF